MAGGDTLEVNFKMHRENQQRPATDISLKRPVRLTFKGKVMFKGSYVALATPFKNGKVDSERLKFLVDFQIEQGTEGLVPCGSTGESATLSHEEHKHVIEVVIKAAHGRVPVMAGAGSNSTLEALDLMKHAARAGADAALQIVPYYNKPTPAGLFEHFKQIARATKLPIFLYNIPGRTGITMPVETVVRLAQDCPTIIGIKEATGSMDYTSELVARLGKDRFTIFSGDDSLTIPLLALGAKGVISVIANILPAAVWRNCAGAGKMAIRSGRWNCITQMFPLMRALFVETNPIPLKAAMSHLGLCREELRSCRSCRCPPRIRKKLMAALKGLSARSESEIVMVNLVIAGSPDAWDSRIHALASTDPAFKVVYGLEAPARA